MVNCVRIKEYIFPVTASNVVGSKVIQYSTHSINGEILRIDSNSNFTGSIILARSGTSTTTISQALCNFTATSGTNNLQVFPFSNTTGSFVMNSEVMLCVSGWQSGTGINIGPISVLYR